VTVALPPASATELDAAKIRAVSTKPQANATPACPLLESLISFSIPTPPVMILPNDGLQEWS
jgi:hypothetical protein